jgi:SAM-dependent methyltransferase
MSFGGMIGGIGAGLIAPHVFSSVAEYPILVVLAVLCRPGLALLQGKSDALLWLVLLLLAVVIALAGPVFGYELNDRQFKTAVGAVLAISVLFWFDPLKFAVAIALAFIVVRVYEVDVGHRDYVRSFFGVHKVTETADGQFRTLMHGTTEHGAERIRDGEGKPVTGRPVPLTYYHYSSPIAQGIKGVRERKQDLRIAVIGLGTGSIACLTEPGDALTYYEIDRKVVGIATDPNRFTFLTQCAPNASIVVGDARLTLADAPDGAYDVIVVDAFTSDAIPVHLLTREAMAIYLQKLAPNGVALIHVSNRHMELASVVANIAHAHGLVTWVNDGTEGEDESNYIFSSTVTAVARDEDDFGTAMAEADAWQLQEPDEKQWVWTDDYSNIIGAMIRHLDR